MNPDYSTPQILNPRRLIIMAAVAFGAMIVLLIVVSWLLSGSYTARSLAKTPFNSNQNFAQIVGTDIYSYNGLAFTKTNTTNGEITILNKGVKLPVPKQLYWANSQGALMSFSESFTLSNVENELLASGQIVDEVTKLYTWYYNFSDSSLHKVSNYPVVANQVGYSTADGGFYYIPDMSSIGTDDFASIGSSLHFYNTQSSQDTVISEDLKLTDITYVGKCHDQAYSICVIGRDQESITNTKLYGITRDSKKTQLLEATGRLVPTNKPELFITTEQTGKADHSDEDATYEEAPAILRNLSDNSTKDLDFTIADETIFPYFYSTDEFFALTASTSSSDLNIKYVSTGKNKLGGHRVDRIDLTYSDGTPYESSLGNTISYGNDGRVLAADSDGSQLLFQANDQQKPLPNPEQNVVKSVVDACVKTTADSSEYFEETRTYRIFFDDYNTLNRSANAFSDCVIKSNKQVLLGYNYYFGALDPGNGRIVTD